MQITLEPIGILAGDCSCPVVLGGHCKHAAALLLNWLNDPDVLESEDLPTSLERRSKAELIALIGRMIERDPAWKSCLNGRLPAARAARRSQRALFGSQEAILLHLEVVESLINMRGRGNYAEAAARLKRVQTLYANLGQAAESGHVINEIREKNRSLRVLEEELTLAGL